MSKEYFIEKTDKGEFAVRKPDSERASTLQNTQKDAIAWVKEHEPDATIHVERVNHTEGGNPDKWRKV